MDHFAYKNGNLHAENVSIDKLANDVGTPFYCYSTATLVRHINVLSNVFKDIKHILCFAVKANSNIAVLKTLANQGAGADTVSEGEIRRAVAAGISAEKIVFSGIGKTRAEMAYALQLGIMQFNVESYAELEMLNEVAQSLDRKAAVGLRVNPDVDAKTHEKISTGRKQDKFGIAWDQIETIIAAATKLSHTDIISISTHIGSQLTELDPFKEAFTRVAELVQTLRSKGVHIHRIDLGGGLGIPYKDESPPDPKIYAETIASIVKHLDCELVLEPGRVIAGNAGILVSRVIYTKKTEERVFVIVDAAMNDLLRPSLYDAYHKIIPVKESSKNLQQVDIVGPVCESADILGKDRSLPALNTDDLIAIRSVGAYGAVMSNNYNSRLLVPEILVNADEYHIIRSRQTYDDMLAAESIPGWF